MCDCVNEEWRPVVGWEGLYEVSNLGRVKRLEREIVTHWGSIRVLPEMIMTTHPAADGYVTVQLKCGDRKVVTKAARLVAEAFIPNPSNESSVIHINGDRGDDHVENLRWGPRGGYPRMKKARARKKEECSIQDALATHIMPGEEWRDVKDYEGLYLVSNYGRVFSCPRPKSRYGMLKPATGSNGYQHVTLCKNGSMTLANIHQLVAEAFIDNPGGFRVINHMDEQKDNNFASNLEWCDHAYNVNYGTGPKRRSEKVRRRRRDHIISPAKTDVPARKDGRGGPNRKPVSQYDLDGNLLGSWSSIVDASRSTGIGMGSISKACKRDGFYIDGVSCGYRWDFRGVEYDKTA